MKICSSYVERQFWPKMPTDEVLCEVGQTLIHIRVKEIPPPKPGKLTSFSLINVLPVASEIGLPPAGQVGHVSILASGGAHRTFSCPWILRSPELGAEIR